MEVIEKIEKYIEGKLDGQALHEFENQLKTNPQFKQEVEEFKVLIDEIKKAGEKNFAAKVQEWEVKAQLLQDAEEASKKSLDEKVSLRAKEDREPEPSAGPGANWIYVAIPTAAAMIILLAFWLIPSSSGVDASQLYADNFSPYPDLYTNMGEIQDDRQKAIAPYNEGNYAEAVNAFEEFLQEYPEDHLAKLYLAISLVENEQIEEGQNLLDRIIGDETNSMREVAQWYKALTFLKTDDLEACKRQLVIIKNQTDHDYQRKAEKLLGQLD